LGGSHDCFGTQSTLAVSSNQVSIETQMPGQEQHMLLSKHHAVSSTCEPEPKDVGRTIYDDEQICEPGTRLETEDVPGQRSSSIATVQGVINNFSSSIELMFLDSSCHLFVLPLFVMRSSLVDASGKRGANLHFGSSPSGSRFRTPPGHLTIQHS